MGGRSGAQGVTEVQGRETVLQRASPASPQTLEPVVKGSATLGNLALPRPLPHSLLQASCTTNLLPVFSSLRSHCFEGHLMPHMQPFVLRECGDHGQLTQDQCPQFIIMEELLGVLSREEEKAVHLQSAHSSTANPSQVSPAAPIS